MEKQLEKDFLDNLISKQQPCKIIMLNGFQMRSKIIEQDDFVLLVKKSNEHTDTILVYKAAISTIVPLEF